MVECRDRRRPADVEWIDQLIGKYQKLAGKVVAVSSAGFTGTAREKASALGIDTMTIDEATDTNWLAWVRAIDSIWVSTVGWLVAGLGNLQLADASLTTSDFPPMKASESFDRLVFMRSTGERLTAQEILDMFLDNTPPDVAESRLAPGPNGLSLLRLGMPPGTLVVLPDNGGLEVTGIQYLIRVETDVMNVPLKPGEFGVRSVATGTAAGNKMKAYIAFVEDEHGQPRMNVRLEALEGDLPAGRYRLYGLGRPLAPPGRT